MARPATAFPLELRNDQTFRSNVYRRSSRRRNRIYYTRTHYAEQKRKGAFVKLRVDG